MVVLTREVFAQYDAFTCYNSPYVSHDDGRAIDLYPGGDRAPSPVAGEVVDTRRVRAPSKPYAADSDVVTVIDTAAGSAPVLTAAGKPAVARILHVDPAVEPGDRVAVGDDLGPLIRAGFFAPWVDNHLHVGFRPPRTDQFRAGGSLPVAIDLEVVPLDWDGEGRVVEVGETYLVLDRPRARSLAKDTWVGIATDQGDAIDGGLPHYANGGLVRQLTDETPSVGRAVSLLGTTIGATGARSIAWDDVDVRVDGESVTGLSLFIARPPAFGTKIVWPGHDRAVGDRVTVSVD